MSGTHNKAQITITSLMCIFVNHEVSVCYLSKQFAKGARFWMLGLTMFGSEFRGAENLTNITLKLLLNRCYVFDLIFSQWDVRMLSLVMWDNTISRRFQCTNGAFENSRNPHFCSANFTWIYWFLWWTKELIIMRLYIGRKSALKMFLLHSAECDRFAWQMTTTIETHCKRRQLYHWGHKLFQHCLHLK